MESSKQASSSKPWPAFPWRQLRLQSGCVEICCTTLSTDPSQLNALGALLSTDEQRRLVRVSSIHRRREIIYSRGMLRRLLGALLDQPPQSLELLRGSKGKPSLAQHWQGHQVEFNLSHACGLLLIAVALDSPLGIDVEKIRPDRPWQRIARRFFHPAEYAAIQALPSSVQKRAFYACWCRKEAYLKALGGGIALGLGNFQVSVETDRPARLLESQLESATLNHWTLSDLAPGAGYQAALAIATPQHQLRQWRL